MRPSRPISKTATGCCPGIARPAHRSVILACTVLTYHANGKSETLSVIAPAPCGEPSRRPLGGGAVARATVSLGARSGAGAGRGVELAIDGSSLSPARGVAEGRGAEARSGSANGSPPPRGRSGAAAPPPGPRRRGAVGGRGPRPRDASPGGGAL